jgi:5-methyltetrahydropteroyltriglutamate--homocysteine methyltransferase
MKRSIDRILVSHAGSLPRPDDLRQMLIARDGGQPYNQQEFTRCVRSAVTEVVRKQVESGVDIVNDGELPKINFTAYAPPAFEWSRGADG